MFCEQPANDIGVDATIEYVYCSRVSKKLLGLQIKSGKTYFREKTKACVVFRTFDARQYNYWTKNPLPCVLMLHNPEDDTCIWQKLTFKIIERTKVGKGKGYVVKVPFDQIFLGPAFNQKLLRYSNVPEYIANYNFFLSQKRFMGIIQNGGTVKLHSIEWVNKSSDRVEAEPIVDDGRRQEACFYPCWFPYTPYEDIYSRLFMWATFKADEELPEEEDRRLYREYNCRYDEEKKDWIVVGNTFEEFRRKSNLIISIDHVGEVAEYMIVLGLNGLGKSFLKVDKLTSMGNPYFETRPVKQ